MTPLVDFFDRIYCINLDRRPDRWSRVQNEFARVRFAGEVERFPGVEHREPWIGCLESHVRLVETAKASGLERILVFEDDVIFLDGGLSLIDKSLRQLEAQESWSMFYLGAILAEPAVAVSANLLQIRGAYCTHAYGLHQSTYDEVLAAAASGFPIDVYLRQRHSQLMAFHANPIVCLQRDGDSDVNPQGRGNMTGCMISKFVSNGGSVAFDEQLARIRREGLPSAT